MKFSKAESEITIELRWLDFEALIQQGQALRPLQEERRATEVEVARAWRKSLGILKRLDDHAWQMWLREIQSDTLIIALWYLKDRDIAKAVMRNCSKQTAERLTDDLDNRYHGQDPDESSLEMLNGAQGNLTEMLSMLYRLADEGQIAMEILR
jgi:hypothetical protein